jgi:hypothetical protein
MMNWRAFQAGFICGTGLAAYSQYAGATGFQTAADLVTAGAVFGVLTDALWAAMWLQWRLRAAL